uniref:Uncharacterized protein n=1 Tax=Cacopsylla melanoneura TaxID=428564 RepID=A0A8D8ZRG0_9HEMI
MALLISIGDDESKIPSPFRSVIILYMSGIPSLLISIGVNMLSGRLSPFISAIVGGIIPGIPIPGGIIPGIMPGSTVNIRAIEYRRIALSRSIGITESGYPLPLRSNGKL